MRPSLLLLLPLLALAAADPDPVAAAVVGTAAAPAPAAAAAIVAWTGLTIDAALAALPPATPVLLEFYAHWCPACQRFAPHYERAAAGLAGSGVVVARVDCADESAVCNRYGVRSYPTLRLGAAAVLADGKRHKEAALYEGAHDGDAVAAWARAEAATVAAAAGGGATPATADTVALPAPVREMEGRERGGGGGRNRHPLFVLLNPLSPPRPPTSTTSTKPP